MTPKTQFELVNCNRGQPLYRVTMVGDTEAFGGFVSPLDDKGAYVSFFMIGAYPTIEDAVRSLANYDEANAVISECADMFDTEWDGV